MTVIAGFHDGHTGAIGADSGMFEYGGKSDENLTNIWWPANTPKVWRAGLALLGSAGATSPGLLAEESKLGDPHKLATFMRERKDAFDADSDWDIMVVNRTGVWMLWQDFTVERMKRRYHASGAASGPALGALAACKALKQPSGVAVRLAAQASCDHHAMARPPVVVLVSIFTK